MKKQLLFLFIILCGFNFRNNSDTTRWVITNGCSLRVDGSTNINDFTCDISNYSNPDTILVIRSGPLPVQLHGNIQLDVQTFNCHNGVMTADLRKTLKVKEFPRLTIRFISISKYPEAGPMQQIAKGMVTIELAGVSNKFDVDYKIISSDGINIKMEGSRKINFSDFNLIPPRKLGGMIKTNNELSVVFNLNMKVIK